MSTKFLLIGNARLSPFFHSGAPVYGPSTSVTEKVLVFPCKRRQTNGVSRVNVPESPEVTRESMNLYPVAARQPKHTLAGVPVRLKISKLKNYERN